MKNFRAFIFALAALTFSVIAQAAPVQYQFTATHTLETDLTGTPVDVNDYLFADETTITATFYYDPLSPAFYTNNSDPTGKGGLSSQYRAISNLSIEIAGHLFFSDGGGPIIIDYDNASPYQDVLVFLAEGNFAQLTVRDFKVTTLPQLVISGPNDMLSDQSLPNGLTGINSNNIVFQFAFLKAGDYSDSGWRYVTFENGTIAEVPLPGAALFFLSGLTGLGANIFRKTKK